MSTSHLTFRQVRLHAWMSDPRDHGLPDVVDARFAVWSAEDIVQMTGLYEGLPHPRRSCLYDLGKLVAKGYASKLGDERNTRWTGARLHRALTL